MKYCLIFIFCGYLALEVDGYVLLQVRKDANHSNVDAVIHKQVSSEKFDKIAEKLSRKSIKERADEDSTSAESSRESDVPVQDGPLVIGLNTGAKGHQKKSEGIDLILKAVKGALKSNEPYFRSKTFELNDSETAKNKQSLGIEIDSLSLIDSVKKFISSKNFKRATENFARKAAIVLRALKDDYE